MPITPPSCIARNESGEETITRHTCVIDTLTPHPRVFGAQFEFIAPSGDRRQATTWSCVRDRNGTPYDYRRYGGLEVSCDDGSSTTQFITQASASEFETTYGCADHVTSSPCPGRLHRDTAGRCVF